MLSATYYVLHNKKLGECGIAGKNPSLITATRRQRISRRFVVTDTNSAILNII